MQNASERREFSQYLVNYIFISEYLLFPFKAGAMKPKYSLWFYKKSIEENTVSMESFLRTERNVTATGTEAHPFSQCFLSESQVKLT